jgi:hypothetical protein
MQQLDDLNRRFGTGSKVSSIKNGKPTVSKPAHQKWLDEIGGEPLVGSGFESEEPENCFSQAGEES